MPQPDRWDLLIKRDDLTVSEIRAVSCPRLEPGQVRLAVEKFGLTTNNATYARFGESEIPFFDAFPGPEGYGRVPIWGYALVEESLHPDIAVGDRFFGYMPMSTHHVVAPEITPRGFADTTPQRQFLHPWYWNFERAGAPDGLDDRRALIHPVYPAAYSLADMITRQAERGARSVIVTSASSKVSIGLVEELAARDSGLAAVGLTAARHVEFVRALDLYDTVASYDELATVEAAGPSVFVDVTGDAKVRINVSQRFADDLLNTTLIGFTHPEAAVFPPPGLGGPEAEGFFTPAVEWQAVEEEGADSYYGRYTKSEDRFLESTESWLTIRQAQGPEAIAEVFGSVLAGKLPPDLSYILRP
ncbi:DUF2855 family protein [Sphaerisporangium sp. TRM90804]|uniref:DUF2855 family protein n=1 Tax=Sphaerisporangium sp. TRM90804 TaxID=3031113 RepID=UPI0024483643|nr:DUF2855 family protein [Sphaerisporangium sp. TRM90804]MDH2424517.1 DUF2855 family protein [Sphaerisporangium sp. TRM90804]